MEGEVIGICTEIKKEIKKDVKEFDAEVKVTSREFRFHGIVLDYDPNAYTYNVYIYSPVRLYGNRLKNTIYNIRDVIIKHWTILNKLNSKFGKEKTMKIIEKDQKKMEIEYFDEYLKKLDQLIRSN